MSGSPLKTYAVLKIHSGFIINLLHDLPMWPTAPPDFLTLLVLSLC